MRIASSFAALLLAASLSGCSSGPDVEALQKDVESAIQAKDYAGAVAKADAALKEEAVSKDPAKAWRFESMKLNALAEGGKGAEVKANLERLAGTYDKQVNASLYHSLADKVRTAGDGGGYADLLDAGVKKFPDDKTFQEAIDAMKNSADPAEVERLKALGYL
jgi:hypothetical protein